MEYKIGGIYEWLGARFIDKIMQEPEWEKFIMTEEILNNIERYTIRKMEKDKKIELYPLITLLDTLNRGVFLKDSAESEEHKKLLILTFKKITETLND